MTKKMEIIGLFQAKKKDETKENEGKVRKQYICNIKKKREAVFVFNSA